MDKRNKYPNFFMAKSKKLNDYIPKRLSATNSNLINIKLPNLQNILKNKLNSNIKNKITIVPLSSERKSTKYYSDNSLDNSVQSNRSLEFNSGYKTSSNKKLPTLENDDYFPIYQKRRMTRNSILKKNNLKDSLYNNSNSSIQKKNRTIINIYNNSVKNSPKIFLLSSLLTSSTSIPNSSNNITNNKKFFKDKRETISVNSMENLKSFKNISKNKPKITLKKRITINLSKKPIFKLNLEQKSDRRISTRKTYKNRKEFLMFLEKEIQKKHFKDGPDYNEVIRNKFINKYVKEKIDLKLDKEKVNLITGIINETKENIKNIIIENIQEEDEKSFELILYEFYEKSFTEDVMISLQKYESYTLLKYFKKIKNIYINKIPDSIPKILIKHYFEYDIYPYMVKSLFKIRLHKNIKVHLSQKLKKARTGMNNNETEEDNFYFVLEKFIKYDLILERDHDKIISKLESFILQNSDSKSFFIPSRKSKKKIKRKYSYFNKLKIPSSILSNGYFNRKNDIVNFDRRVSYIRKLKFKPTAKIKNIKFHVNDQRKEMSKNRNMSKENLIFRTEEIKNKMKKKLKTIEEILFFLIKENNLREFKDIQERFQISLESRNKTDDTLLIYATKCEKENFVEYLIKKGAFINAQNNELNTPLHYALNNKNFKISDILLKAGADEKIVNKINLTPWEFMDEKI